MRSPLSGSLATCLIFVPLVAVPLLAVVGTPSVSPTKPNAGDDLKFVAETPASLGESSDLAGPVRVAGARTEAPAGNRENAGPTKDGDPFAEFSREGAAAGSNVASANSSGAAPKRPQRWLSEGNALPQKALFSSDRSSDDRAAAGRSDQSSAKRTLEEMSSQPSQHETPVKDARRELPEAQAVVANDSETPVATAPTDTPARDRLASDPRVLAASAHASAWKRAVGRLNALGIRDFQLQPGDRDGEFNFSCRFASRSNPRVIHRFEAEAPDPLDAVNNVLRQVDDWRARHTERGQASAEPATKNANSPTVDSSEVEVTNRAF
jgi:hypothetical protein